MTQEKIGVESQPAHKNTVVLGLAAVFLTYFLVAFMNLGLGIASPMIAAELNGMDLFSWAISLPALAAAFATLLFGKLSDMYGRRKMLLVCLFLGLAGAIMGAVSRTFVFNIIARMVNGLGFGATIALCFSVIGDMYAPVERSKWTGLLQISATVAAFSAPFLTGVITDNFSWRYFFWAIVPTGIVCVILVIIGVPGRTERKTHIIDYMGTFLVAVASSCMILGFSYTDRQPWISFHVLGLLVISLVFWCLFILNERKAKEPILDPQVFTNRTFLTAAAAAFLSFFGFIGILNYYPLFLQGVQGTSTKISGAMQTPFTAVMNIMGVLAGLLIARTKRYKWMMILSYAVLMIAMFGLVFFNQATPLWLGVIVMILGGFGVGSIPTINVLIVQFALPPRLRGISVGAIFFICALGTASAPAIMGPAMNATYENKLENLLPPDLDTHIDGTTLESLADPRILMSKNALIDLQDAFNRIEDQKPALFDQTVQAVRAALQTGMMVLFLIGAVALFMALLFILTIPEVSMDAEVEDKNSGQ